MRSGPRAAKRCAEGAGLDGVAECQAIIGLAEGKLNRHCLSNQVQYFTHNSTYTRMRGSFFTPKPITSTAITAMKRSTMLVRDLSCRCLSLIAARAVPA